MKKGRGLGRRMRRARACGGGPAGHFSPWDYNWPYGCAGGPATCPLPTPTPKPPSPDDPCKQSGSIIECETQVLGERVPITGTSLGLHYSSRRARGYAVERRVVIPLVGAPCPTSLDSVNLTVDVAGQHHAFTFPASPNLTHTFEWDGKDVYGRDVAGSAEAKIAIAYLYPSVYLQPAAFEASFAAYSASGIAVGRDDSSSRIAVLAQYTVMLRTTPAAYSPVGGWSLNVHHAYDVGGRRLLLGDGSQRSAQLLNGIATTFAGIIGGGGYDGDGGPASAATLNWPTGIAVGPNGALFIAEQGNNRIRRVSPDGIITTVAGTWLQGFSGDGGPATAATLNYPMAVAVGADGALFIADAGNTRIRRVSPDGIITTVAGTDTGGFSGDGGPAIAAELNYPYGVAVGSDGAVFVSDTWNNRIRRVGPDGIITTVAGAGTPGYSGDGGPATAAELHLPKAVAVRADGALFIADTLNCRIRYVGPDGFITTFAGTGTYDHYLTCFWGEPVELRLPNGDGGPATAAEIAFPWGIAVGADGAVFAAEEGNSRIRVVRPALPGLNAGDFSVASEGGDEVFLFNSRGRHLRTLDARTKAVIYSFGYDDAGRLASITDRDGLVTTIERSDDIPTAIVAPHGKRTSLTVDGHGYLNAITNPAGGARAYSYDANGLMQTFTDP